MTDYSHNALDEQTNLLEPAGTSTSDFYDANGNLLSSRSRDHPLFPTGPRPRFRGLRHGHFMPIDELLHGG